MLHNIMLQYKHWLRKILRAGGGGGGGTWHNFHQIPIIHISIDMALEGGH